MIPSEREFLHGFHLSYESIGKKTHDMPYVTHEVCALTLSLFYLVP